MFGVAAALVWSLARSLAPAPPGGPFEPLWRIRTQEGPKVVARPGAALPLVAIRLSVPVRDGSLPGATRVLAELGRDVMGADAAPFGGHVSAERLPGFVVFTVVGPARSFDDMVALLRRAVGEPSFDADMLARARGAAARAVAAMLERPASRTRALLRQRLFLDSAGIETGNPAVDSLTPDRLRHVWSQQFRPERMNAVVVGSVPTPAIRAAFSRWRHPVVPGTAGGTVGMAPRPQPQVLTPWAGIGYRVPADAATPVAAVATELVRRQVAGSGLRDGTAELWWQPAGRGMVVLGTAREGTALEDSTPARPADLRATLRQQVAAALAAATPDAVSAAARRVRVDLLLAARTPAGAAEVIGRFMDVSGRYAAAQALLAGLLTVQAADVRALLERLLDERPVFAVVGP